MGQFIINNKQLPNYITKEGMTELLKYIAQDKSQTNFYIGLTGMTGDPQTLSEITDEPATSEGYARIAVERSTTGFPTIEDDQGIIKAVTKQVTFTPTSTKFTQKILRLFIATSTDSSGKLIAVSRKLDKEQEITKINPAKVNYKLYIG